MIITISTSTNIITFVDASVVVVVVDEIAATFPTLARCQLIAVARYVCLTIPIIIVANIIATTTTTTIIIISSSIIIIVIIAIYI